MPETKPSETVATEKATFKVFIKGPIEAVWREITKTDSVQQCFFNMRLHTPEVKAGKPYQMRTKDNKYVGVVGEILECNPPHRFVTTFKFTEMNDPPCKIIYELKEVAGGTEFIMSFEDLAAGTATAKQMVMGGNLIIKALKGIVETGQPPFGVRMMYAMIGVVDSLKPASKKVKLRAENWPLDKP